MQIVSQVTVAASREKVFDAWAALDRIPEWYPDSLERTKITDGEVGVGTRYHAVDRIPPGRTIEGTLEVVGFERPNRLAATLSDPYNAEWVVEFEDAEEGTLMTMSNDITLAGILGLISPLLKGWAQRTAQVGLDNFKSAVETGSPG